MYINSFEILNLPHDASNWEVGDTVIPQGKNTLFVGANETGKSTILDLLNRSIDRYDSIINREKTYISKSGFDFAFGCFTAEEERGDSYDDEELYKAARTALKQIYRFGDLQHPDGYGRGKIVKSWTSGTINIWNPNYRATKKYCNTLLMEKEGEKNNGLHDPVYDLFIRALGIYARKEDIDSEVVYGNIVMMLNGSHDQMYGDIQWGYVKPEGHNILVPKRVVLDLEQKDTNESGGEWSKRILSKVRGEVIAFLRQPLNELDIGSQDQATELLIDGLDSDTQVFMESHDRTFIKEAKNSDKWLVHDLGEKIMKEDSKAES